MENYQNANQQQQIFEGQRNNLPDGGVYIQEGANGNNYIQMPNGEVQIQSQEQYTGQRAGSNFVDG